MEYRPHVGISRKGHLTIGGADTVSLAEEFGTPLYVVDEARIRERYREFHKAFSSIYPKVEVRYAYKANTSLAVLHILRQEGAGADVVSEGEIYTARKVGLDSEQIIFTGNNKSDSELELAVDTGVVINIDATHEAERLEEICARKRRPVRVSFRINPAVSPQTHPHLATGLRESKFGIPAEEALEAYRTARDSEYLEISGIHMHIGSQITRVEPYVEATNSLLDTVLELKEELGIGLDFIDIGGGLGIRYKEAETYITPRDLAGAVVPILKRKLKGYGKQPALYLEPGRYIVGDAAVLLAQVSTIKETSRKFVGVDAGFQTIVRPTMYDAYHEVIAANRARERPRERVEIAGNICESGDILARERKLPRLRAGDIIAIMDAGAYGLVMASQYNSRPRPAEVLVREGKYELIRERETFDDLLARQRVPKRLLKR